MADMMVMAHSGWRYLVLLVLIVAVVKYLMGMFGNGKWSNFDSTLNRITPIVLDIQLLLGIVVWIMGSWWASDFRQGAWEHPIIGVAAVLLAHFVSIRVKKSTSDRARYRMAALGYLLVAVVVALGISLFAGWNIFA